MREVDRPPVTLIDPDAVGPTSDLVGYDGGRATGLQPRERWLALAVAVVVVAGLGARQHLQSAERARAELAALRLHAVAANDNAVFATPDDELRLSLDLAGRPDATVVVRRVASDAGWQVSGRVPAKLAVGDTVVLRRSIACDRPLPVPTHLRLRVDVAGAGHDLVVPIAGARAALRLESGRCGRLGAADSTRLTTSSVTALGRRSAVVLTLANISVVDVLVDGPVMPGFAFRPAQPLPLLIPGWPPARTPPPSVPERTLAFEATVSSCPEARRTLARAEAPGRNPDELLVRVHGTRGAGEAILNVAGLEAFLAQAASAGCPDVPLADLRAAAGPTTRGRYLV